MKIRNKIISFFAIIIIVFGMLGLVPCAVFIYLTGKINITNPESTYIVNSLSSSVKSVNVLLDNSSEALANVAGTVQEAQDSLKDASGMFKSSSIALAEVADIIEFEILGIKPLDGMSKYFSTMSEDAEKLSQSIFEMSASIGTNIDDIKNISTDVSEISLNLSNFSTSFSATAESFPDINIKIILYAVFAYLSVLNLIFVLVGLSLFYLSRQTVAISA